MGSSPSKEEKKPTFESDEKISFKWWHNFKYHICLAETKALYLSDEDIDRAKRREIDVSKYNVAFIGRVGVGKSTLVNALRGKEFTANSDENCARIKLDLDGQVVDSHTRAMTPYRDSYGDSQVVYFDVPGLQAVSDMQEEVHNHDIYDYYKTYCLFAFDCIVFMVEPGIEEFKSKEIELIRVIHENFISKEKKPKVLLVKSKMDAYPDLQSICKAKRHLVNQLEDKCLDHLIDLKKDVFLISARNMKCLLANENCNLRQFMNKPFLQRFEVFANAELKERFNLVASKNNICSECDLPLHDLNLTKCLCCINKEH